ncbi:MAG: L,D-transpeptidase [Acidimicrobiales bacterium]|jgi:lipoprotein-anchoring transpeptidase ErfK/SrfK|nr:L,D-transpeptidase [Acidimicrobiales bacterium]
MNRHSLPSHRTARALTAALTTALLALLLTACAGLDLGSGQDAASPESTMNARIVVDEAAAHRAPSSDSEVVATLGATTVFGSPTTVLVLDQTDGWLQVALPVEPNGSRGWIPADVAQLRTNEYAVRVDLGAKELTLTRAGETVLTSPVAIGTDTNPTPTGAFFVTDFLDTGDASGSYGPYAFGLSAHSETLDDFAGGDGQVGLHGTNEPDSIGTAASHGCVRVPNDVVEQLADVVSLGTPVTIV